LLHKLSDFIFIKKYSQPMRKAAVSKYVGIFVKVKDVKLSNSKRKLLLIADLFATSPKPASKRQEFFKNIFCPFKKA